LPGLCFCCAAGCHGSAHLEIASLNFQAIDLPPARFTRLDLPECYWWKDKGGRVWIAMRRESTPLFNPRFRFDFQVSLALDKLPAGKARNYKVDAKSMRACVRFGPWETRFTSRTGIVAIYRESGGRLRGSMRLYASRQVARLLGGWSRPSGYLLLGSLEAVHDEQRGRAIAEATESAGWGREEPAGPTSRPSTAPASGPVTP
jgi:hypothetical protein